MLLLPFWLLSAAVSLLEGEREVLPATVAGNGCCCLLEEEKRKKQPLCIHIGGRQTLPKLRQHGLVTYLDRYLCPFY